VCVRSLRYPARKAQAPYYIVICGLSGSTTFYHITSKTARFSKEKKKLNIKCILIFCTILSATFLILRRTERDIINVLRSSCKVPAILARFQGHLRFLEGVPKKHWNIAQSVYRLAAGWTVRGSNPGGDEIFRTHPDRPWGPPSLLHNGYRVFPGGKAATHPPHLASRFKKVYSYTSTPPLGLRGLF